MPLNQKKIISIIMEQSRALEERCDGYREEILHVLGDILLYERHHRIKGINVQQKISDKCDATGRFLSENTKSD